MKDNLKREGFVEELTTANTKADEFLSQLLNLPDLEPSQQLIIKNLILCRDLEVASDQFTGEILANINQYIASKKAEIKLLSEEYEKISSEKSGSADPDTDVAKPEPDAY